MLNSPFLLIPNLIGYARICLALWAASLAESSPSTFVVLYLLATALDAIDGPIARALGQCSKLGAIMDVLADNVLRSTGWMAAALVARNADPRLFPLCLAVVSLEWATFLANTCSAMAAKTHWKEKKEQDPLLIRLLFRNNFRNPLGCWVIGSLFFAPLCAYVLVHPTFDMREMMGGGDGAAAIAKMRDHRLAVPASIILFLGRAFGAHVELYFCYKWMARLDGAGGEDISNNNKDAAGADDTAAVAAAAANRGRGRRRAAASGSRAATAATRTAKKKITSERK